jgi:hypothetical protein
MRITNKYYRLVTFSMLSLLIFSSLMFSTPRQNPPGQGCVANVQVGRDINSSDNPFFKSQTPSRLAPDQSLQFGDVLVGTPGNDLLIGGLGSDVLIGNEGDDILIGGPEHGNALARDYIFGGPGDDIIIWSPGDGSDFIDGGPGRDVVIIGLVGEVVNGQQVFRVSKNRRVGQVFRSPTTNLPSVQVINAPTACQIVDRSTSPEAAMFLEQAGLTHLVQVTVRRQSGIGGVDAAFTATLHMRDVEAIVCTGQDGSMVESFDLTVSPPAAIALESLNRCAQAIVR